MSGKLSIKERMSEFYQNYQDWREDAGPIRKVILVLLVVYLLAALVIGVYWSSEPDYFSVHERAAARAEAVGVQPVVGFTSTSTLIEIANTLLEKPGGYIQNDKFPPGLWLDNMPSWEQGVIIQMRDFSRAMRSDFSRSQSQSTEDKDLAVAEPQMNFNSNSWILPSTEKEYKRGVAALERYLLRLADQQETDAQFYTRADNLRRWLNDVETRLGSLSQRLSASVGRARLNTDLAGDAEAQQSTPAGYDEIVKTPWTKIDNVYYETRGTSWALLHLLRAVEIDFYDVLEKKNALVSLRQIIRELEATQETLWSPMVLNGNGFGLFANHSLVMSSYITRANAALKDLSDLLAQG